MQDTLKLWYSYQLQYVLTLGFLKLSILAFYVRINGSKKYKLSIYLLAAIVVIYTIIMTFVNAFECKKPSDAWALTWPKKCHNLVPIYYLQAGFNIVSDIVILLLPLPTLLKLQVNKAKKIALISIFSFGSIAVIASIVRITALYKYHHSKDIPEDGMWLLTWSQIEINVAIITGCAPALKPLMKRTFGSSFFGKSFYGAGYASKGQYESNASRARKGDLRLDSVNDSKLNESEEDIMERGEGIKRTTQIEVEVTKSKPHSPNANYSEKY
ncbi:hypothetical protein BJ508DRAFT_213248 [Ascobolus immersus RN42]|uniref:Rhodopsin domain-containing protein n=1 Tax=Ascobolus immersus RN42 TaxID=1160509 RepID=A0A3N4HTC1_ASCIM|nr:hypothetical protein BJ508DRAFT_213248 [Ascobolus immersus RN42]